MSRDDFDALPSQGGEGLGCEPFGHLASPFADGELPPSELDRFQTHLGGCVPCRRLMDEYRALDLLASPATPEVPATAWDTAWAGIVETLESDRTAAEAEPLAPVFRAAEKLGARPLPRAVRPLLYLAASLAIVAVLFAVQRSSEEPTGVDSTIIVAELETPELECLEPGYMPIAYNIADGDEIVSVMYCAYVGVDT